MIDAIHSVSDNKLATEMAIKSFREFNPESTYVVIGDSGSDHYDICKKYNCIYINDTFKVGYPSIPLGFDKEKILRYLKRTFVAANLCKGTHIMIMEDDVCIINPIKVSDEDEMLIPKAGLGNKIDERILQLIRENAGCEIDSFYGMGGGSIFKRQSFLQSYDKFYNFIENNFDKLHKIYSPFGWPDCIMSVCLMFIGKKQTVNTQLHELGYWGMDFSKANWEGVEEKCKPHCSILHHFKKYYNSRNY